MNKPEHRLSERKRPSPPAQLPIKWVAWSTPVVFVFACVAHTIFRVDTRLRYEAVPPVFFWDQAWAGLWYPGGFARELSSLLLIFEGFSTGGAVLVTLIEAVLIVALSWAALGPLASRRWSFLGWLPLCLWLILQSFYSAPVHEVTIGLATSLGLLVICNPIKSPGLRVLGYWFGTLLSLWLAGPVSCVLLALLGGLTQFVRGATKTAVWSAASAFWLAMVPFDTLLAAFWRQGPAAPLIAALDLSYVLVAAIWIYCIKRGHSSTSGEHLHMSRWHVLPAYGLIGLALVAAFYAVEWQGKSDLQIKRSARLQDWPTLLETARRSKAVSPSGRVALTRALYHEGLLGDEMFSFRQIKSTPLLPDLDTPPETYFPVSEVLLDLGQVNSAEHFAQEALEMRGPLPRTLETLATIYAAKGQPQAARVFASRLRQVPLYASRAAELNEVLGLTSTNLSRQMADISALAVTAEGIQPPLSSDELFTQCLSRNARNRVAFELLIASYLINSRLDRLVPRLVELPLFGYKHIPRHYEEAALLFEQAHQERKVDFGGLAIRDTTIARFRRFQDVLGQRRGVGASTGSSSETARTLVAEFGDTYWFYFLFGETPGPAGSRVKN